MAQPRAGAAGVAAGGGDPKTLIYTSSVSLSPNPPIHPPFPRSDGVIGTDDEHDAEAAAHSNSSAASATASSATTTAATTNGSSQSEANARDARCVDAAGPMMEPTESVKQQQQQRVSTTMSTVSSSRPRNPYAPRAACSSASSFLPPSSTPSSTAALVAPSSTAGASSGEGRDACEGTAVAVASSDLSGGDGATTPPSTTNLTATARGVDGDRVPASAAPVVLPPLPVAAAAAASTTNAHAIGGGRALGRGGVAGGRGDVPVVQRLPSRNLTFGSAEILTVSELASYVSSISSSCHVDRSSSSLNDDDNGGGGGGGGDGDDRSTGGDDSKGKTNEPTAAATAETPSLLLPLRSVRVTGVLLHRDPQGGFALLGDPIAVADRRRSASGGAVGGRGKGANRNPYQPPQPTPMVRRTTAASVPPAATPAASATVSSGVASAVAGSVAPKSQPPSLRTPLFSNGPATAKKRRRFVSTPGAGLGAAAKAAASSSLDAKTPLRRGVGVSGVSRIGGTGSLGGSVRRPPLTSRNSNTKRKLVSTPAGRGLGIGSAKKRTTGTTDRTEEVIRSRFHSGSPVVVVDAQASIGDDVWRTCVVGDIVMVMGEIIEVGRGRRRRRRRKRTEEVDGNAVNEAAKDGCSFVEGDYDVSEAGGNGDDRRLMLNAVELLASLSSKPSFAASSSGRLSHPSLPPPSANAAAALAEGGINGPSWPSARQEGKDGGDGEAAENADGCRRYALRARIVRNSNGTDLHLLREALHLRRRHVRGGYGTEGIDSGSKNCSYRIGFTPAGSEEIDSACGTRGPDGSSSDEYMAGCGPPVMCCTDVIASTSSS